MLKHPLSSFVNQKEYWAIAFLGHHCRTTNFGNQTLENTNMLRTTLENMDNGRLHMCFVLFNQSTGCGQKITQNLKCCRCWTLTLLLCRFEKRWVIYCKKTAELWRNVPPSAWQRKITAWNNYSLHCIITFTCWGHFLATCCIFCSDHASVSAPLIVKELFA